MKVGKIGISKMGIMVGFEHEQGFTSTAYSG